MDRLILPVYFLIKTYLFSNSCKNKDKSKNIVFSLVISVLSYFLFFYISGLYGKITAYASVLPFNTFPPYALMLIILDIATSLFMRSMKRKDSSYITDEIIRLVITLVVFSSLISTLGYFQITGMLR